MDLLPGRRGVGDLLLRANGKGLVAMEIDVGTCMGLVAGTCCPLGLVVETCCLFAGTCCPLALADNLLLWGWN
jgi:hypothetical protein